MPRKDPQLPDRLFAEADRSTGEPDPWSGDVYDLFLAWLEIEASEFEGAYRALWEHPDLYGCFRDRGREPWDQPRVEPVLDRERLDDGTLCASASYLGYGVLPGDGVVPIHAAANWAAAGGKHIHFCLPMGGLERVADVAPTPSNPDPSEWRTGIDPWLIEIAEWMHARQPLTAAIIGFAVPWDASEEPEHILAHGVPDSRRNGFLTPGPDRLVWHPPTVV